MTFNRATDFEFDVHYQKNSGAGGEGIAKVKVTGLTEAMTKHKDDIKASDIPPKVRVTFELSSSGIVSVPEANLHVAKLTLKEKVKSFFGGKDSKETEEKSGESNASQQNETTVESNENTANATAEESISITKVPLTIDFKPTGNLPLTQKEKEVAKKRIIELDALDVRKKLREESRNMLETFVYRVQDFLYDDIVSVVATEETIEAFREKLSETSDWLYDEGEHAETPIYISKLKELQALEGPIQHRFKEYKERTKNTELVNNMVKLSRDFVDSIRAQSEDVRYHTEEELETLASATDKLAEWMKSKLEAQSKLADTEEPVLLTSQVSEKTKLVEEQLTKLLTKKKPKVPKKTTEAPKNDTTEEAATSTSKAEETATETPHANKHPHDEF